MLATERRSFNSLARKERLWKRGIRARIQPVPTTINSDAETPSTTTRYRIFVEENIELDHTCRIRGAGWNRLHRHPNERRRSDR